MMKIKVSSSCVSLVGQIAQLAVRGQSTIQVDWLVDCGLWKVDD
jgi:hypothetical protein